MGGVTTFINIGPGRCGTSWLYEIFTDHDDIAMSKVKETEYFNTYYDKGDEWYRSNFPDSRCSAVGEISNNYYLDDEVALRIYKYNPSMKLIINIRDPVSLLVSFYKFGIRRGIELPPLEEALTEPTGRIMGSGYEGRLIRGIRTRADTVSLLESVLLGARLEPFIKTFKRDQIYFFVYDRLVEDPLRVIQEIYEFLDVNKDVVPSAANVVVNQSIIPRSRFLARIASRAAFTLRKIGAHRTLTSAHRSRIVKRILYSEERKSSEDVSSAQVTLPDHARSIIMEDLKALSNCESSLKPWVDRYLNDL